MKLLKPIVPFLFAVMFILILSAKPAMAVYPPKGFWDIDNERFRVSSGWSLYGGPQRSYATVPEIDYGTTFNGFEEVAFGRTKDDLSGKGFAFGAEYWTGNNSSQDSLDSLSDEELWDSIDSLEKMGSMSLKRFGSVPASIGDSLDILYEEDYMREEEETGMSRHRFGVRFHYEDSHMDGTSRGIVPMGGPNVANTYIQPFFGQNSNFLGPAGLLVTADTTYDTHSIGCSILSEHRITRNCWFTWGPQITYGGISQDHKIHSTSPSFTTNQFNSSQIIEVDEHRYGIGGTVSFAYRPWKRLFAGGGLSANAVRVNADLDAMQHNMWAFGLPQEMNFMLKVNDNKSFWTYDLNPFLELYFKITKNVTLGMRANFQNFNKTATVRSRNNPNMMSPHITTDNLKQSNVWVGFLINPNFK